MTQKDRTPSIFSQASWEIWATSDEIWIWENLEEALDWNDQQVDGPNIFWRSSYSHPSIKVDEAEIQHSTRKNLV